jgi:P-type conjugative transfer ATPase TrbB
MYSEKEFRLYSKLHQNLGPVIINALEDEKVNEVMLNPDGTLWLDTIHGMQKHSQLSKDSALAIINTAAGIQNFIVNFHNPRLECQFPFFDALQGQRFTAQVPPLVEGPSFTIRKKSSQSYILEDYLNSGRCKTSQKEALQNLVKERANILVCGGPGSGKTTVTKALIKEINEDDRILILEDLPEIDCQHPNRVSFLTTEYIGMRELLRTSLRMRPDRILIGEVRGGEALDMIKAWNTGCPGGICTVHANGAAEALQRISDLCLESGLIHPPFSLIQQTIQAIVHVTRHIHQNGFIQEILQLQGYENGQYKFAKIA